MRKTSLLVHFAATYVKKIRHQTKKSLTTRLRRNRQRRQLHLQLVEQVLVVGMLAHHHRHRAALDAHGRAQVLPARRVTVRNVALLADGRQVAHDLDRGDVAGEDDQPGRGGGNWGGQVRQDR